jgi:hypothetical protein
LSITFSIIFLLKQRFFYNGGIGIANSGTLDLTNQLAALKLLKERLWWHDFRAVIGSTPRLLSADDNFSFQAHFLARA